jgi:hypothetical protein
MGRLRSTLTLLSTPLALTLLVCWPVHRLSASTTHLGLGRGYRTVELDAEAPSLTITFTHYTLPLTQFLPDALFLRTERFHIWAVSTAPRRLELGNLKWIHLRADYVDGSTFSNAWSLSVPYWLALLLTLILPTLWLTRRRTPDDRGFPMDQPVGLKSPQPPSHP